MVEVWAINIDKNLDKVSKLLVKKSVINPVMVPRFKM